MAKSESPVTAGATLSCSLGTKTSKLKVPKFHGVGTQHKYQANISDYVGNINIMPFDMCKRVIPPVKCNPDICMKWIMGKKDYILDSDLVLLDVCMVPCVYGGIVEIKDNGQSDK